MKLTENQKQKLLEQCHTFYDIEQAVKQINASKGPKIDLTKYFSGKSAEELDANRLDVDAIVMTADTYSKKMPQEEFEIYAKEYKNRAIEEITNFHKNHPKGKENQYDKNEFIYGEQNSDFSSGLEISNKYLVRKNVLTKGYILYGIQMYTSYGNFGAGAEIKKFANKTTEITFKGHQVGTDYDMYGEVMKFSPYGKVLSSEPGDWGEIQAQTKPEYKEKLKEIKKKIIKENISMKKGLTR